MKNEGTISRQQLFFVILQTQIGVGILTLPYEIHEAAGKDGWLSILIAGLLVQAGIAVICFLALRFPDKTLYDFSPLLVGRIIGFLINTLYMLFFFIIACQILSIFLSVTTNWVFSYTPPIVFASIIVAITIYLIKENIRVIARFYVLMSFLLVVMLFVFVFMFKHLNLYYLLPIGSSGVEAILSGSEKALFSFAGFEFLLWLFPLTQAKGKEKWQAAAGASLVVTIIYVLLAVCCYAYFSTAKLKHVPEPVLYMIKAIDIGVVERLDLIFLSLWAVFSITSFMSYLYLAATGAAKIFKAKHHKNAAYLLGLLVLPVSVYTSNPQDIKEIGEKISSVSSIFLFGVPLFLLAVAMIRRKREDVS